MITSLITATPGKLELDPWTRPSSCSAWPCAAVIHRESDYGQCWFCECILCYLCSMYVYTHIILGLNMFLSVTVFFPNTAMSGCKASTYRSIVFLKSWICRTGSNSMSVLSGDSIWGSMSTSFTSLFPT